MSNNDEVNNFREYLYNFNYDAKVKKIKKLSELKNIEYEDKSELIRLYFEIKNFNIMTSILDNRELEVIGHKYLSNKPYSLRYISNIMNLSKSTIARIEITAINKLIQINETISI